MDNFHVYKDIEARTGGEIYIGVVGPVRTGKSTFIKRFMELMVLPGMNEGQAKLSPRKRPRSRWREESRRRSGSSTASALWRREPRAMRKTERSGW